jgi:hypothetical protein
MDIGKEDLRILGVRVRKRKETALIGSHRQVWFEEEPYTKGYKVLPVIQRGRTYYGIFSNEAPEEEGMAEPVYPTLYGDIESAVVTLSAVEHAVSIRGIQA